VLVEKDSTPGALRVRSMSTSDMETAAEILRQSPGSAKWSQDALENSLENRDTLALVAEHQTEIIGLIIGAKVGDEAEIFNLAVKDSHRRRGVGKQLVENILEEWSKFNLSRVFLEVRESNAAAIELYDGLGFRRVGRRLKYYRDPEEDALVLARQG
jgi:ribosomal-protein-alanine acetyltransferase